MCMYYLFLKLKQQAKAPEHFHGLEDKQAGHISGGNFEAYFSGINMLVLGSVTV